MTGATRLFGSLCRSISKGRRRHKPLRWSQATQGPSELVSYLPPRNWMFTPKILQFIGRSLVPDQHGVIPLRGHGDELGAIVSRPQRFQYPTNFLHPQRTGENCHNLTICVAPDARAAAVRSVRSWG